MINLEGISAATAVRKDKILNGKDPDLDQLFYSLTVDF